jgi:hypothetical protein
LSKEKRVSNNSLSCTCIVQRFEAQIYTERERDRERERERERERRVSKFFSDVAVNHQNDRKKEV